MAFFNQGDFTQLGVAGHVNANLRLNEKRLVNIDMTSNENAEGCTITGTVKDLLNNKVYNIGSAPSGNIEITENGENINVAAYATATVNVSGGGDMSIKHLTVNLVNTYEEPIVMQNGELHMYGLLSIDNDVLVSAFDINSESYQFDIRDILTSIPSGTTTLVFPYIVYGDAEDHVVAFNSADTINHVTYSNMTYDSENVGLIVTDGSENAVMTYTPVRSGE